MTRWQYIIEGKCPAGTNMDRDLQCLNHVTQGRADAVLRIYDWDEPAVTVGHHIKRFSLFDPSSDIRVILRPTGGGAVLHKDDITFSLSVPEQGLFSEGLIQSYLAVSRIFAKALTKCGMNVHMEGKREKFSRICFDRSTPEELVYEGKKILGLALLRYRRHLLFQGVLPLRIDKGLMESAFGPAAAINSIGILDAFPGFQKERFFEELADAFSSEMGVFLLPYGDNNDTDRHHRDKGEVYPGGYEI